MLSTGGENDLDEATKTAHAMVSVWGMSEAIGPVTVGEKPGEIFIARDLAKTANIAAATHELVDSETRRLTHDAEDTAKQIIEMNRAILEELANTLLDTETLSGPALDTFLEAVLPWQQPLVKGVNGHVPPVALREAVGVGDIDGSSGGAEAPDWS
jgi:cell division protease FtsH